MITLWVYNLGEGHSFRWRRPIHNVINLGICENCMMSLKHETYENSQSSNFNNLTLMMSWVLALSFCDVNMEWSDRMRHATDLSQRHHPTKRSAAAVGVSVALVYKWLFTVSFYLLTAHPVGKHGCQLWIPVGGIVKFISERNTFKSPGCFKLDANFLRLQRTESALSVNCSVYARLVIYSHTCIIVFSEYNKINF